MLRFLVLMQIPPTQRGQREEFGNLVEVWSTKESRDAKDDAQPFSRGIDSFQIVHAHGRYWIASLVFDHERPGLTLPAKYLKSPGL
ncbi:MAG: hypothetical protein WAL95_17135 [Candidatus Acidiferrales bacterium]